MRVVVTGGCGFVGAAVVRVLVERGDHVLNVDNRRKAAVVPALQPVAGNALHVRLEANVADRSLIRGVVREFKPDGLIHLAAASGDDSERQYEAQVAGSFSVLEACRDLLPRLDPEARARFRIVCATRAGGYDEGAGRLAPRDAATRTASTLLRDWSRAYDLPLVECVADEVFGPWQADDALVPRMAAAILSGEPWKLEGAGETVRDFLPVRDFAQGLVHACTSPARQARYEFSVGAERRDVDVAQAMCALLDQRAARPDGRSWSVGIELGGNPPPGGFGPMLDPTRAERILGWSGGGFHEGLNRTLAWALMRRPAAEPLAQAAE